MRIRRLATVMAASFCCTCYASAINDVDTRKLTFVDENHANLKIGNVSYTLDSYIVMFQQPYYVKVKRDDNRPMRLEEAVKVAKEYIQPRGCTEPLARRADLDKYNSDKSQWLIGISC